MTTTDLVRELARVAEPLRTTEAGAPSGDPRRSVSYRGEIVGLGEHAVPRQFFTLKMDFSGTSSRSRPHHLRRGAWSTGLVLNKYVLYWKGDPEKLNAKEFQLVSDTAYCEISIC